MDLIINNIMLWLKLNIVNNKTTLLTKEYT